MLQTIPTFVPDIARNPVSPRRSWVRQLSGGWLRFWHAQCRRATHPDRFVPYC